MEMIATKRHERPDARFTDEFCSLIFYSKAHDMEPYFAF